MVSPFAPPAPAMHGGDGVADKDRIDRAVECGGMAEVLRSMDVDLRRLGGDAGWLPVTAATDFAIEVCERLTGIHDAWMTDGYGKRSVDAPADIRSLGVILYKLLGGESSVRTDLPLGLQSVVLRCLKSDRAGVIPDAKSLAIALAPYASHDGQLRARRLQHVSRVPQGARIASASLKPQTPSIIRAHSRPSGTVRMLGPVPTGTVRMLGPAPTGTVRMLAPARATPVTEPAEARTLPFRIWLAWVAASLVVVAIAIGAASHALPLSRGPVAEVPTVTAPGVANRMPDVAPDVAPSAAEGVAPPPAPTPSERVYQPEELPLVQESPSAAPAKPPRATPPRSHTKRTPDRIGPEAFGF